jgi:voltage-gated potassium channel
MAKKSYFASFKDRLLTDSLLQATMVLLLILIGGSFGYRYIGGMSFFDGFFQTFITISTIGFSELNKPQESTRALTIVLAIFGIGTTTFIGSQIFLRFTGSEVLLNRAIKNKIKKMNNHYIICGYGRIGHRISQVLLDVGIQVVVIDNRESSINRLKEKKTPFIQGDASEEETLFQAGIERAKGLVCALSKDQDNIFTTLLARELNPTIFIISRTNEQKNERRILRAGADKVIAPYEIGSDHMSNVLLRPKMVHFIDSLMAKNQKDHLFDEITVFPGSSIIEKSLSESKLRDEYGIAIIATIPKKTNQVLFNPSGSDIISEGDTLIVLGDHDKVNEMRKTAFNDKRTLIERVSGHDYLHALGIKEIRKAE